MSVAQPNALAASIPPDPVVRESCAGGTTAWSCTGHDAVPDRLLTQPGDELRLEHTCRIHGTHQLPDDFTLSAVVGAGFEVTEADSEQSRRFLQLSNANTLSNLSITYLNTPPPGAHGTSP